MTSASRTSWHTSCRLSTSSWSGVKALCFNGVQFAINRVHWEMLLCLPMLSSRFPEELVPLPQHLDMFAQFLFTYLAVADGIRNAMEWRDCYASVHRMHIWTASIETQWMFRNRPMDVSHPDGPGWLRGGACLPRVHQGLAGHAILGCEVPARCRSPQCQRTQHQDPLGGCTGLAQPGLR